MRSFCLALPRAVLLFRAGLLCAVLVASLVASLGGCSSLGLDIPQREVTKPPADSALLTNISLVAKAVKWPSMVEVSPVRQAAAISPADWIVCVQGSAQDRSPDRSQDRSHPYALFFNGNTMVHYRLAVQVDDCTRVPYAPVAVPAEEPPRPPLPVRP
jgi:hypothetical protein